MSLLSWFRRPTPPLEFATQLGEVRPLEAIPLETIQRAQRAYEEALALDAAGDERAGIGKYSEAIDLVPEFWEALDNRGMSRIRFGKFAEPIPDFERSAQLNPESPLALVALIKCYRETRQSRKAVHVIRHCLRKWPNKSPFPDWGELTRQCSGPPRPEQAQ